jgi:hypothetical protein
VGKKNEVHVYKPRYLDSEAAILTKVNASEPTEIMEIVGEPIAQPGQLTVAFALFCAC